MNMAEKIVAYKQRLLWVLYGDVLGACESPAEELFLLGCLTLGVCDGTIDGGPMMVSPCHPVDRHKACSWEAWATHPACKPRLMIGELSCGYVHLVLQPSIQIPSGTVRPDFALVGLPHSQSIDPLGRPDGRHSMRVAIEVDGHDWHERTRIQAARDKGRDRELQCAGWDVLRFTGSEVYESANACALTVAKHISEAWGRTRKVAG